MDSFSELDLSKKYTYADYLTWKFEERVELLRGYVFKMSPAPNLRHQKIVGDIYGSIWTFLKKEKCQVFIAPFDVRLPVPKKKNPTTVLQPDITVVCDEKKLDVQGCNGSPDLVVEVLSPGNTKKEMKSKLEIYQEAKIPEYWIVNPEHEFVIIYTLNETGKYISSLPYTSDDKIESQSIKGFRLDLGEIFQGA